MVMSAVRRWCGVGAAGALLCALALGMAACGASTPVASGGPPVACGTVSQGATLQQPSAAHTAENCFWQAYQHCQPATLTVKSFGVDAGATHTLTLTQESGGCRITDVRETYVVPGNSHTTATFTCSSMKQQSPGLLLQGCGAEGDVQIQG